MTKYGLIKMAAGTAKEHLFKVLVIGEFGVGFNKTYIDTLGVIAVEEQGKTSIIRRYVEGYFTPNYKLTIGVDFALKTLDRDPDIKVNLQLWDIAGHERFGHMTRVYYKYAIAAIIVFDLSRPATFDSIPKWLNDVNTKVMLANEEPVPVMLLANKCDVEDTELDSKRLDDFCKTNNLIGWYPTSAKDNVNIDEAMQFLVEQILALPSESEQPPDHISIPDRSLDWDFDETDRDHSPFDAPFEQERTHKKQSQCCT